MKEQLKTRLTELKGEFASGQQVLADLEAKQVNVRETLLRIAGAIQALEELAKANSEDNGATLQSLEPEIELMTKSNAVALS